jgi:glycosyltransferase involved in cell wall biosynthesis
MKILMLGWEFPPFISGGLGPATAGLARELSRRGHQLTFALPYKLPVRSDDFDIVFAGDKVEYAKMYQHYSSVDILQNENLSDAEKFSLIRSMIDEVRLYAKRMKDLVKELNYDIVHAHDWLTMPAGMIVKKEKGRPLVSHVHATEYYRSGGGVPNQQVFNIEHQGMHNSEQVVCISHHVKNIVTNHYRVPEGKVSVVHNGVDWHAWRVDNEKIKNLKQRHKLVLSVGRLTIQKGVDYLLEAARLVHQYEPEALFVIIGDGDMKDQLLNYTLDHNMMKYVHFTNWLSQEQIAEYYAAADLFVMPSVAEPFGLVALEAALLDTPAIISKTSGAADVFKHCLKVDFWDARMLAANIISVLRRKSLRDELAKNGKRNAQAVTWADAAVKVENIYHHIIT